MKIGKKAFAGYFNEFANGINPWSFTPMHGVFDASDLTGLRDAFETYGLVVIRRMFTPEENQRFYEAQKAFTGMGDADIRRVMDGEVRPSVGGSPALNDPAFWPFIVNDVTQRVVREIFGNDPVTEIGTSCGAHYSARGLHRDLPSWYSNAETGMSLDGGTETSLRVLMYPSQRGRVAGSFGVIPFSHRRDIYREKAQEVGVERPFDWYDRHRDLIKAVRAGGDGAAEAEAELNEMDNMIDWVQVDPGDAVLLDSRAQHSGDFIIGPRYLFTTTFVRETPYVHGMLSKRWTKNPGKVEAEYYDFLQSKGLASDTLIAKANDALSAKAAA